MALFSVDETAHCTLRVAVAAILLTLLYCSAACAEQVVDAPCANVQYVEVQELEIKWFKGKWRARIQLTPQASESFYVLASRHKGETFAVRAGGAELYQAGPRLYNPQKGQLWRYFESREAAYAFADAVCAEKVRGEDNLVDIVEESGKIFRTQHPELVVSPSFAVSCESVVGMQMFELSNPRGGVEQHFSLLVYLTRGASRDLVAFQEASDLQFFLIGDAVFGRKHIQLVADGRRIVTDRPWLDTVDADVVVLSFESLDNANAAVDAICKEKGPDKVIQESALAPVSRPQRR